MTIRKSQVDRLVELRQKAEATYLETPRTGLEMGKSHSAEALQWTLHELEIHQIELAMQNEELCRSQVELESMRAGRLPPPRKSPASDAVARVTNREREILGLIGQGHSSKQIGEILRISPRTVETHRWRIMQKLAISNGPGLVKFAIENDIIQI
jgi:DNA-binding NarL/FixJ family response regulator